MSAPSSKTEKLENAEHMPSGEGHFLQRRKLLIENVRKIVRARELFGRGPRWTRAWKKALWRYTEMVQKLKERGR